MSFDRIYDAVVSRLLREAAENRELAAYVSASDEEKRHAVVYDPFTFARELAADASEERVFNAAWEAVRGYIMITKPDEPCGGAWQVSEVWGPGYGSEVYGLGYVMSPSGILMPDRFAVSKRAAGAWERASQFLTRIPLDDCYKHNIPSRPWLDFAYSAGPRASRYESAYAEMTRRHEATMKTTNHLAEMSIEDVEEDLRSAGRMSFGQNR